MLRKLNENSPDVGEVQRFDSIKFEHDSYKTKVPNRFE